MPRHLSDCIDRGVLTLGAETVRRLAGTLKIRFERDNAIAGTTTATTDVVFDASLLTAFTRIE